MPRGAGASRRTSPSPRIAVALRYDPDRDLAPRVVAKGRGVIARRIAHLAEEAGVPTIADPQLAAALFGMPLGAPVPPHAYQAVAELLAAVWLASRQVRRSPGAAEPIPPSLSGSAVPK